MANLHCSIDFEPRTLREYQLNQAREVAVEIMQKKEPEEASSLFVGGLKPDYSIKDMVLLVQERETLNMDQGVTKDKVNYITEKACQCFCASATVDSPDQSHPKEPLSAPF